MHGSRQQRIVRLLKLRLVTLVLLLALILLVPAVWSAFTKAQESGQKNQVAQVRLADLKQREAALSAEVEHLKTERGLEEALRHQFDVGESGEGVVYIVERAATNSAEIEAKKTGWFSWWPF